MRIELVGRVGLVHNGKGDSEPQPLQVPHLHEQVDIVTMHYTRCANGHPNNYMS